MNGSSRRDVLGMGVLGAIAAALPFGLPGCATSRGQGGERVNAKRRLARVAHITDSHTQAERGGFEGTCAMWEHLNALRDKPDLVLHGGDIVFDVFAKNKAKSQEQWDLYLQSMRAHNKLPVYHALGNHDIWGWDKKASETTGGETGWGKAWAVDLLGMPGAYYAFEARGVKFVVLDTVQPRGDAGYEGGLGDAQFEWLQGELANAKLPVVILTHIPAVHASSVLVDARLNNDKNWITGGGASLMDRVQVVNLISRHRNISAVLSGHIHMVERVDYAGTSWINSGAVCGSWWQSQQKSREFLADRRNDKTMLERPDRAMPGYGLLDVYSDGSIGWEYVEWGWQPKA